MGNPEFQAYVKQCVFLDTHILKNISIRAQ